MAQGQSWVDFDDGRDTAAGGGAQTATTGRGSVGPRRDTESAPPTIAIISKDLKVRGPSSQQPPPRRARRVCSRQPALTPHPVAPQAATDKIFKSMDLDGDGNITPEEAAKFFKSFGKLNAGAMFNEVDVNSDGDITMKEWDEFWRNVKGSGYSEEDMLEELENMAQGQSWVDFDDGRDTDDKKTTTGRGDEIGQARVTDESAAPTLQLARKGSVKPS